MSLAVMRNLPWSKACSAELKWTGMFMVGQSPALEHADADAP